MTIPDQFDSYQTVANVTSQSTPTTLPLRQFELVAKALADPRRVAMLEAISHASDECPCERLREQFPISKGTISHHMKELLRAGLIRSTREGQYVSYEVCRDVIAAYTNELQRRLGTAE